jgi:glycosyltransferase involved in cell wall biosynthesis
MYQGKTIAVVVPAYNEEHQIAKVINTMPASVDRIVVVDDASRDDTKAVVLKCQAKDSRVELIAHAENQGVGGAIASGYKWVRDHGLDVAVVMAGDAQMDPAELPGLLDPVVSGEVDYTKGNRLYSGEAYRNIPKSRFFGNAILSMLTKIASGYWHIADSQCGYTAINLKALKLVAWDNMYQRYGQPNDLLVKLNIHDLKVRDVVMPPVYNVGERSGIRIKKVVFTIGWLLVKLFFWRLWQKYVIRDFHPLVFLYVLGILLLLASLGLFLRLCVLWVLRGHIPEITALAWMFSGSVGLQSAFFAMWLDMEKNRHLK